MKHPKSALAAALAAAALVAVPTATATATTGPVTARAAHAGHTGYAGSSGYSGYAGSPQEAKDSKAFFDAVMRSVAAKRAANPGAAAVTVTYSLTSAPNFRSQIARSTQIWNSSVSNVKLQEGRTSDFTYRQGNDSRGSYASTDGHGRGYIFLDLKQTQEYDATRVVAHETGHVLGLPDHYTGPCSELMSGHGPGTSCTNAQPDSRERARVDQLWRNGFAPAAARAAS
ncbi:snapalysin [Streptomyces sp. LP05-1]|uniref:Extracellular small neutral protease n=1 Tax=Streptomyces pyxinae TaxID=2970734 RepID=A0ABT2CEL8_9ACTN|nr:snapalysin [Streptomyces sp. LP05-1]MCS0635811.1 snapalysin [Streptomyces sp. LP05-1]